jgi:hypothetical protein
VQAVFGGSFDSFGSLDTLLPSLSSFSFLSFLLFSSLFPPLLFSPLFLLFRHKPQKIAISLTKGTTHHDSLPGMWNDWCSNDYLHADFARVIVRMEDLIFYGKHFQHIPRAAMWESQLGSEETFFIEGMIRYGTEEHRSINWME